jgi:hexosaminidase
MARRAALIRVAAALTCVACSPSNEDSASTAPVAWTQVIPRPAEHETISGHFTLDSNTSISVPEGDAELERAGELLASVLRPSTGYAVPVVQGSGDASIRLSIAPELSDLGDEGYELRVDSDGVSIRAPKAAGVFYGAQTFRQLLPARVELGSAQRGPWRVAAGVFRDRPRFAWRGFMVDVARHFFTIADLKRYVDLAAYYKLNRFHVHLTDDQGWRIEIKAWPKLTEIGAATEVGGGPGGFYTQAELGELIAYAAERFVVVVPEIDVPGHCNAALVSVPELNCDGVAPEPYTGTSVGISSICIGSATTNQFVADVVKEIADITPGPYLHIGGDEALKTNETDYVSFMNMVQQTVEANGKTMVGWEETAKSGAGAGTISQHWRTAALAEQAAANGARVLMSPAWRAYLSMKYDLKSLPGKGTIWAGVVNVRTAYDWDPGAWNPSIAESQIEGLEAAVWTETLESVEDLDVMVFPRLVGDAELAWSPWQGHDADAYLERVGSHGPRLEAFGVGYFAAPDVPWSK